MGLIDAINRDPGEEAANDQAPEGVSPSEVRVEVEELHPPAVVVPVPDLLRDHERGLQEAARSVGGALPRRGEAYHLCRSDGSAFGSTARGGGDRRSM